MEFFACVAGGLALIGCGVGLFSMRAPSWPQDDSLSDDSRLSIARWSKLQRAVRYLNNGLLIVTGTLIFGTAWAQHGRFWMLLWAAILLMLMISVALAFLDALASLSGYRQALPHAARRALGNDPDSKD